jgi:hypothetical protein
VEYNDENIMYLVSIDTNLQLAFFQLGFSWTSWRHTILKKVLMFKTVFTFWPEHNQQPSQQYPRNRLLSLNNSRNISGTANFVVYKKALEDHDLHCVIDTHSRNLYMWGSKDHCAEVDFLSSEMKCWLLNCS